MMDVCHGVPCGINDPASPSIAPDPIERLRIAAEVAVENAKSLGARHSEIASNLYSILPPNLDLMDPYPPDCQAMSDELAAIRAEIARCHAAAPAYRAALNLLEAP